MGSQAPAIAAVPNGLVLVVVLVRASVVAGRNDPSHLRAYAITWVAVTSRSQAAETLSLRS